MFNIFQQGSGVIVNTEPISIHKDLHNISFLQSVLVYVCQLMHSAILEEVGDSLAIGAH